MKKTTVVLCSITAALMLAGSAAAGHGKPVSGSGFTVTPLSFSSGR
jgi:hypothetical protein